MNLLDSRDELSSDVFFVNFNQDCTSLAIGSKKGFRLFSFSQTDELELIHENTTDDVRIVERLFSSSLVAVVTISAPRKLKVCHFKKGSEICNYSYSNTIVAVKLNRARLVVCLEESLYIHNIKDMKIVHTIRDTPPNPSGLCVLSVSNDSYLAYPGSSTIGEVQIFDAINYKAKSMIPAHDNPLAAMSFDPTGTKLATASEKGTVIRVFNVADNTKLYEFRRGVKRCAKIYSLSFSEDSAFLSASSNTETVHIFKLDDSRNVKPSEEPQSWIGYVGKAIMQSASYLPSQVADMFNQGRSFATVHLPFSGVKNICCLATIQKKIRVVVVSSEENLYIYDLDIVEGGDCSFVISHILKFMADDKQGGDADSGDLPSVVPSLDEPASRRVVQTGGSSYAAVVRGSEASSAQDRRLEKTNIESPASDAAMGMAGSPPRADIKLDYESDFPPMVHKSEL